MEGKKEDSSIVKGKRNKRRRHDQLSSAAAASVLSPMTSLEFSESTIEEENMANCLILLARGGDMPESNATEANCLVLLARGGHKLEPNGTEEATTPVKLMSWQFSEAATTTSGKARNSVHEYQTCNKRFPSHQVLGGHSASHKKPKLSIPPASADGTRTAVMNEVSIQLSLNSFSSPVTTKARIHQCAACGKVFDSGQALGGHMRLYRTKTLDEPTKKEGNLNEISFDLNLLPLGDDEDNAKKLSFWPDHT